MFEKNNIGSFIYCKDIDSLKLLKEEILNKKKRHKNLVFNIITNGSSCKNLLNFLKSNEKFDNCIENICVFCKNIEHNSKYKDQCQKIHEDIYKEVNDVIEFLKRTKTKNHYFETKIILGKYYNEIYRNRHFQIAQFYENLNPELFRTNIENIRKKFIKGENGEINLNDNKIINGFLKFEIRNDLQDSDELIIKEYTKGTFSNYLNECLTDIDQNLDDSVAYFASRLIFSLNSYAKKNNMYCTEDKKKLYIGIKMPYSRVLSYEKAKDQIITFPQFLSTTESEFLAKNNARRGEPLDLYQETFHFSVIFIITNVYNNNWVSSAVNIQNISEYKGEKEILFLPFSFFKVLDVQTDTTNYTADIYLKTVGKKEILENQIKNGKGIRYNMNLNELEFKI